MPTFETARLLLRPFEPGDAVAVHMLAGDAEVARTSHIPHPYPPGAAEAWIAAGLEAAAHGSAYPFALALRAHGRLIGCVTLLVVAEHRRGGLAYWVGRQFWGQGYATEAGTRVVRFGFEELRLNRTVAGAMTRNRASTRVMEKLGMRYEGTLRQEIWHWGAFEDVDQYGLLRDE
jgi:RimJ/RimL family protein N-acetyltransferase